MEPNSFYCLSGQICAQAQGGRGANLSIADVYTFSAGVYDSQGEWRQVELYGQTGPRQRSLTVYARLGGYSGESLGEAWFANLSLKKVESIPAGAEVTLFYQPSYSAESKTFFLDLRHLLLAVLVLLYGLMPVLLLQKRAGAADAVFGRGGAEPALPGRVGYSADAERYALCALYRVRPAAGDACHCAIPGASPGPARRSCSILLRPAGANAARRRFHAG